MFIAKKHLSRRTFLRGSGVTLALPLLDAMVPAATLLAQTSATPKPRFVANFIPHGMSPGYWVPDTVGTGFTMPPIFEPLAPFRKQTVILSGLHARSAEAPEGQSPPDHWVASAFLCANKPKRTAGADVSAAAHRARDPGRSSCPADRPRGLVRSSCRRASAGRRDR